jgi:hypothetical protein
MTTLLATVTASQDAGGTLVAGSTIYAVLCVIEFLIVMAFASWPLPSTARRGFSRLNP